MEFFVISWVAVLVALGRDQILRRLAATDDLAAIAGRLERLETLVREYGDLRETEGYLEGMNTAQDPQPPAEVRQIHPRRPQPPTDQ